VKKQLLSEQLMRFIDGSSDDWRSSEHKNPRYSYLLETMRKPENTALRKI